MSLRNDNSFIDKFVYNTLIFIQAPADLSYALDIYKTAKEDGVLFCVVNVKAVYDFVKSLDLKNADIIFIEPIKYTLKKPYSIITAKSRYKKLYEQVLKINVRKIYFFSRIDDMVTCGLVGNLSKNKDISIFYCRYNDNYGLIKISKGSFYYLKNWIHSGISRFITKAKFTCRYYGKPLEFAFWEYPINEIDYSKKKVKISKEFLYSKGLQDGSVLFLLSPMDIDFISKDSATELIEFLKEIKSGGRFLCLKGHPRIGVPKEIEKYFDVVLPKSVLSEFIDYSLISEVVGLGSTGLAYVVNADLNTRAYSIVKHVTMINENQKTLFINYLNETTSEKMNYVSLKQLKKLLCDE